MFSKIRSLLLLRNSLLRRIGNAPRKVGFCSLIHCTSYSLQPIFRNFPVFFPVSREFGAETGSPWTASSTTQSYANRDFPVHCEMPRTGGVSYSHFVSASSRLDFSGCFGAFVSGRRYRVSRRRRPALAETRFECWVSAREDGAIRAAATIRVASR